MALTGEDSDGRGRGAPVRASSRTGAVEQRPENRAGLLANVAGGDPDAIRQVIEAYGGMLWALALRRSLTRADAEDAVQDIFLDLWRSAPRFDPSRMSEPMFVMMIARRRLIDRSRATRRRAAREVAASELLDADGAYMIDSRSAHMETSVEAQLAQRALQELPSAQQHLILLAVSLGLTHQEIASREGLPLGTVKTQIRRGLIKVRQALGMPDSGSGEER